MLSTKKFTQEEIKGINRVNVINFVKEHQTTTKQEIANALELSVPTVTTNINQLLEEGLIEEVGIAESTGGRKPLVIGLAKNAKFSFGVSIRTKYVRIRLINLENDLLEEVELPYIDIATTLKKVAEIIENLLQKRKIKKEKVVGIGFSLPGVVDDEKLVLGKAPNLRLTHYDFNNFQESIGLKVWIENEANVGAFAELKVGNAKNINNLVYVSITEGLGTGIIIKEHIYKSNQKRAGEFGHTRITNEKLVCNCGRTGCWELYASKEALIRYYKEATNINISNVNGVFEAYKNGEEGAKEAIYKYVEHLLYGIENIVLALNPDYVIIGGDFGKYEDVLSEVLEETGHAGNGRISYDDCTILFSGLGDRGPLVGASLLPLEDIFNYNKNVM